MIRESFSFEGRLGRRDFLVRLLTLGLGLFLTMLGLMLAARVLDGGLWSAASPASLALRAADAVVVGSAVILFAWAFYALAAKRLRSIGLDPALVIAVSIAFALYEDSVFKPAFGQAELLGCYASPVGHIWDLLFLMVLCLWPQRNSIEARAGATFA